MVQEIEGEPGIGTGGKSKTGEGSLGSRESKLKIINNHKIKAKTATAPGVLL